MGALIEDLVGQHERLRGERSTWDSWCQELGDYVSPRKAEITTREKYPSDGKERRLYDATAVQANMTLGQGQMAYITPMEERWFNCEPPDGLQDEEAYRYYAKCGEIMALSLAVSNFYSEVHEMYLDRSGFGTSNLYVEESFSHRSGLVFDAVPVGSYSIAENGEKLWSSPLPRNPEGLPAMYEAGGKQFLVICDMGPVIDKDLAAKIPSGYIVYSLSDS